MDYKKLFIVATLVAFCFFVGLVFTTTEQTNMKKKYVKKIEALNKDNQQTLIKVKSKELQVFDLKRKIRKISLLIDISEKQLDSVKNSYKFKVIEIKGYNKKQLIEYIYADSNGDSLTLALHLQERIHCLEANEIIISQNGSLKLKSLLQESVIEKQDTIIVHLKSVVGNKDEEILILQKEFRRIVRKEKRKKIFNRIKTGIILVLVGTVIVGAK